MVVRFRTIGDITSTGATLSEAATMDDIIQEVAASSRVTERGGRADDKRGETEHGGQEEGRVFLISDCEYQFRI